MLSRWKASLGIEAGASCGFEVILFKREIKGGAGVGTGWQPKLQ